MKPRTLPKGIPHEVRLLHVDRAERRFIDHTLRDLPALLSPGDLIIVNDAATLPASLRAPDQSYELRLMGYRAEDDSWQALLLGRGDHRVPTEERAPAPLVRRDDVLIFAEDLHAVIIEVTADGGTLVRVRFNLDKEHFFRALYRIARPIQYAYVERSLELWDVQNHFAGAPWAFENPSAGYGLTWEVLSDLRQRGVNWATLTHAAGISSTGNARLDQRLPVAERYLIPDRTLQAISRTQHDGGSIIAIGTTVVRALESNALEHGALRAGIGEAKLVIGPGFRPRVVTALLTGMHERTTSHFALLQAFADAELLTSSLQHAERQGYEQHEFGDVCLIK